MLIKEKDLNNLLGILIGLYFLFSSLDYLLKLSSGASYLRIVGIAIYFFAAVRVMLFFNVSRLRMAHVYMFFLMAYPFLASLWAVDFGSAINRSFTIATTILIVFLSAEIDFSAKQIKIIEFLAVLGAVIAGIKFVQSQGLQQFLAGRRLYLSGDMDTSDPNGMAARLFLPLVLSCKRINDSNTFVQKAFAACVFLFLLALYLMCGSRGAMVGLILAVIVFLLVRAKNNISKSIKLMVLFLLVCLVFVAFADKVFPSYIYERLFQAKSYTDPTSRFFLWKYFLQDIYLQAPFFGFGPFGVYYKLGVLVARDYYAMHNAYLCMLGEYGIVYLPVFLLFLSTVWKRIVSNQNNSAIVAFVGICVIIFFLDGYETKYFWNMILYCMLTSNTLEAQKKIATAEHARALES